MSLFRRILMWITWPEQYRKLVELQANKLVELQANNRMLKEMNAKMSTDIETLEAWVSLLKKDPVSGYNTMPAEYVTRVLAAAKRLSLNGISLYDQPREVLLAILFNEVTARVDDRSAIPLYKVSMPTGSVFRFNSLTFEFK